MVALITGASSGIGESFARSLSKKGYDLILVARRKTKLEKLKKELKTNVQIINMDISSTYNCTKLYNLVKNQKIDLLINNAGFGLFGNFNATSLDKELDMIDINIKTVHTLTKLFLNNFVKRDEGIIVNVASSAGFLSGPLMSTYYATKGYVLKLTEAISEELKRESSNVRIFCLCPGPVKSEFNKVAGVKFNLKSLSPEYVTNYTIKKLNKKKTIIIPGIQIKLGILFTKILPRKIIFKIVYQLQKKKL